MNKKTERILRHEIKTAILEVRFAQGLNILEKDVVKVCKTTKYPVNEGIGTLIGLWLSGPQIVKLFGKFISYMDSIVKKFNNTGFGGEELGEKIIQFSEKYHHKVMWIFEKVAEKFTKDEHKKEKIANLLFTIVIGALLGQTIGDIATNISSGSFSATVIAKSAKAALKAKELYAGVVDAIKLFIPTITAAAEAGAVSGV